MCVHLACILLFLTLQPNIVIVHVKVVYVKNMQHF